MAWVLRGCPVCGGDLHTEGVGLECLQCARSWADPLPKTRAAARSAAQVRRAVAELDQKVRAYQQEVKSA